MPNCACTLYPVTKKRGLARVVRYRTTERHTLTHCLRVRHGEQVFLRGEDTKPTPVAFQRLA